MERTALVAGAALLFITITYGPTSAQEVEVQLFNAHGENVGSGTLVQQPAGVRISLQVRNLTPGPHGFHIHAIGKCDPPDFTSAGVHFNPEGKKHGLKNPAGPHAGDLPNIMLKPDGTVVADVVASTVTFGPGNHSLTGPQGSALVIHANPDDEMTDPAGGAGPRIACGVIGPRFVLQDAAAAPPAQDDVEMVAVPAGDFIMGSDDPEADDNEKPASKVFVGPFSIDKFEVTNGRYLPCIEAGACTRPSNRGYDDSTRANLPVTVVSWQQAVAYCRWVGKRLPTEAEWEKAARGTDGRRYPWGNTFEAERANVGYSVGSATSVGSYRKGASPYGVMDLAGNVWEWASSLYKPYPYDPADGREDLTARGSRVERGGGWYTPEWHARTTRRTAAGHVYRRFSDLGFRCAK